MQKYIIFISMVVPWNPLHCACVSFIDDRIYAGIASLKRIPPGLNAI